MSLPSLLKTNKNIFGWGISKELSTLRSVDDVVDGTLPSVRNEPGT